MESDFASSADNSWRTGDCARETTAAGQIGRQQISVRAAISSGRPTTAMRVMKTAIPRGDGSQLVCDTIQHEGKLWLAPAWLEAATKPYSRPARLIGMSGLKYRSMPMRSEVDLMMEHPAPAAVLEGRLRRAGCTLHHPRTARRPDPEERAERAGRSDRDRSGVSVRP